MKALLGAIVVFALSLQYAVAQHKIDSVSIRVTDLWVHHYSYEADLKAGKFDSSSSDHAFTYSNDYSIIKDSVRGDTLVLMNSNSSIQLVFDSDTSHATATLKYTSFLWDEMHFVDGPVINTPTAYVIDLEASAILASNFSYYGYYQHNKSGGRVSFTSERYVDSVLASSRVTITLFKALPAGVTKGEAAAMYASYPNPARSHITLLSSSPATEASIYDLLGREVLSATIENEGRLDVSHLNPGVYMLLIGGQMRKLVIE